MGGWVGGYEGKKKTLPIYNGPLFFVSHFSVLFGWVFGPGGWVHQISPPPPPPCTSLMLLKKALDANQAVLRKADIC